MRSRLLTIVVIALTGCTGTLTDPPKPAAHIPEPMALGVSASDTGVVQVAAALWTVRVDALTQSASVAGAKTQRSPQATDDLYTLSLADFFHPETFQVTGIAADDQTVTLHYNITHPLPAPSDLDGPATATNRADLGFAGRLLVLSDVPTAAGNTFFGSIIANLDLVADPDGYWEPRGVLRDLGMTANTFPYLALVDERLNPRRRPGTGTVLGNGGSPLGNHSPVDGWQRATIGINRDRWAGFGVLHQGQSAFNALRLNRTAFSDGPLQLELALVVSYVDPRGGESIIERRANRLPPTEVDLSRFVYREPHGALDLERIEPIRIEGAFDVRQPTPVSLSFRIVDWDARAEETPEADLGDDANPRRVAQGTAGPPSLSLCIPGITGDQTSELPLNLSPTDDDSLLGGDLSPDLGHPTDELFYTALIQRPAEAVDTPGAYTGLLRAIDPQALVSTADWFFPLNEALAPLPAESQPLPIVFQRLSVQQVSSGGWARGLGLPVPSASESRLAAIIVDGDSPLLIGSFTEELDFGGGVRTPTGTRDYFLLKLDASGGYLWDTVSADPVIDYPADLVLDASGNIYVTGTREGFGPSDQTCVFISRHDQSGVFQWQRALVSAGFEPGTMSARELEIDSTGSLVIGFELHGQTVVFGGPRLGTVHGAILAKLTPDAQHIWSREYDADANMEEHVHALAIDEQDAIYIGLRSSYGPLDFGGGPRTYNIGDCVIVKYSTDGDWAWDRIFGSLHSDSIGEIAVRQGALVATGIIGSPEHLVDFGGGPLPALNDFSDPYLASYDSATGAHRWALYMGGGSRDEGIGVAIDQEGSVFASGFFVDTASFGGPNRSASRFGAYLVKHSASGDYLWDNVITGPDDVRDATLALDFTGNPIFFGRFKETVDFDPGPAAFDLTATGEYDSFLTKVLGQTGQW